MVQLDFLNNLFDSLRRIELSGEDPMVSKSAKWLVAFSFAALTLALNTPVSAQTVATPADDTISEAYLYLLGRTFVIRQEHIDRKGTPRCMFWAITARIPEA